MPKERNGTGKARERTGRKELQFSGLSGRSENVENKTKNTFQVRRVRRGGGVDALEGFGEILEASGWLGYKARSKMVNRGCRGGGGGGGK